jgi:hypothetical protein
MGFTLQEKSSRARRHATLDPVLPKAKKGEFGGKKAADFCSSAANDSGGYGDHIGK